MRAYLMTRGAARGLDYDFLGEAPAQRWWQPISEWVILERPEVVVRGLGPADGARLLLSGIPSGRRDMIGTAIRYTLALEHLAGAAELTQVVATALTAAGQQALGAALDEEFPAEEVDTVLRGAGPPTGPVSDRVAAVLARVGATPPDVGEDRPGSWVSCLPAASGVFLARVAALADGAPGWAFTSCALRSVNGAEQAAAALRQPIAVLLADGDLPEVHPLGKALASSPAGPPPQRGPRRWLLASAVVAVLATGWILLETIWLARR